MIFLVDVDCKIFNFSDIEKHRVLYGIMDLILRGPRLSEGVGITAWLCAGVPLLQNLHIPAAFQELLNVWPYSGRVDWPQFPLR